MLMMLVTSLLKNVLWLLRYPSFVKEYIGPYQHVGIIQTRLYDDSGDGHPINPTVQCQIHYPAATKNKKRRQVGFHPYFRPEAVIGLADYSRQPTKLLEFLSMKQHPCLINLTPYGSYDENNTSQKKKFPVIIFSHGLGGCYEMYTELCSQLSSCGYVVIAVEHEDGSGLYAQDVKTKQPIYYKRPDDTPYSRQKAINFRKPFFEQRVQELTNLITKFKKSGTTTVVGSKIYDDEDDKTANVLKQVLNCIDLSSSDTNGGISLVGHSFGGATMVKAIQDESFQNACGGIQGNGGKISSLCLLDCWAFSLDDDTINKGCLDVPTLNIISENWATTNTEVYKLKEMLLNSKLDINNGRSFYIPNSVHSSFSDACNWLPNLVNRKVSYTQGLKEKKHETISIAAKACIQHIQQKQKSKESLDVDGLVPYSLVDEAEKTNKVVTTQMTTATSTMSSTSTEAAGVEQQKKELVSS